MQVQPIIHLVSQFWHELVFTVLITFLGAVAMWPIKRVKSAYKELKEAMDSTHAELVIQRENCLNTLQLQGTKQIDLLSKAVETLDGVRLDLREQTTILRMQPPPVPRRKRT